MVHFLCFDLLVVTPTLAYKIAGCRASSLYNLPGDASGRRLCFFLPATLVFLLCCKGTTIYFFTGEGMVYVKREKERARQKDGRREQMERGRQKGPGEKDRDGVGGVFLTVQC